jgi:hypothetical protein
LATISEVELKSFLTDEPNPEVAGQGLAYAPFVTEAIGAASLRHWMMTPAEQMALVYLLERLRPRTAIEIGTRFGGSLQVLAKFCDKVYSLDVDPQVPERLAGAFRNVEFLIGRSTDTLPPLIRRLQDEKAELSFVLVDGDHSAEGVRRDIDNVLAYVPRTLMAIVMHDSFNPECRAGLRRANWAANRYVHLVELDFVCGMVNCAPTFEGQLWGGLALGLLTPDQRSQGLEVTARAELSFRELMDARKRRAGATGIRRMLTRLAAR